MSLFDQQPMGPVPARRPILLPPDPELEAVAPDPATVEVRVVGPLPRELAGAETGARRPTVRWLRVVIALLLVAPFLYEIVAGLVFLIAPGNVEENVRGPFIAVLIALVATMIAAQLWWRRRRR